MPLPQGHWQPSGPPRVSRRERWLIAGVLTASAVIAVIVAISFTSHQRKSRDGCIDVSAATVIGGSELYRCGAAARGLCTAATGTGEENISFRRALVDACRKAGLPVPPVGAASFGGRSAVRTAAYPYVQRSPGIAGREAMAGDRGVQESVGCQFGSRARSAMDRGRSTTPT